MQGMAVFSEEIEMEEAGFFRKNEKRLAREQRKLSRCVKAVSYTHLDGNIWPQDGRQRKTVSGISCRYIMG